MRYLIAIAALGLSLPAHAATTVYTENFDGYPASQVPWVGNGGWTTGNSVDLVKSGDYNLTCVGGTGNCVDLTGNSPGTISTMINLAAGLYSLTFQFTGNQLDGVPVGSDPRPLSTFNVSIASLLPTTVGPVSNVGSAFQTFTRNFTVATSGVQTLTFSQNAGGDQFRGNIIDNISIAAVPEPATWAMLLLGFGLVGSALRRRKRQQVRLGFA